MGIEIIKPDIKEIADKKEGSYRLLRNEGRIYRPWIKDQGQHQETSPCCDMNNNLCCLFIQGE